MRPLVAVVQNELAVTIYFCCLTLVLAATTLYATVCGPTHYATAALSRSGRCFFARFIELAELAYCVRQLVCFALVHLVDSWRPEVDTPPPTCALRCVIYLTTEPTDRADKRIDTLTNSEQLFSRSFWAVEMRAN